MDVQATKEIRFGRRLNLRISAELFNVFNDGTYQIYNPFLEAGQRVNGVNEAQRISPNGPKSGARQPGRCATTI